MSYVPATTGSAAAAAAQKSRDEEENMTAYKTDDLDGWEFKIMRNNFGKFKKYEFVQQLCREEAKAGWEMVEKFDDSRIRFKRRIDKRANDRFLDTDPYRTSVGFGSSQRTVLAIGVAALLVGVLVFAIIALRY